jgi:predicted anti-sigma-YlaC factor YlaD
MSDCDGVMRFLYPYLDGELAEGDRCRVHTHLLGCLTCQNAFNAERAFLHLLRTNTTSPTAPLTPRQIAEFVQSRSSSESEPPGAADRSQ